MTHDTATPLVPTAGDDRPTDRRLVLVTGGSGLLGSRLIEHLVADHDVVSLDLDGDTHSPPTVEFICTDLTDDGQLRAAYFSYNHSQAYVAAVITAAHGYRAALDVPAHEPVAAP